jgi:signal transduction histidine kinase
VNRTKQGNLLTEDVVIAPVRDDAGVIRNYVAVKRDISQELALERQLFGAQKLESVARLAGGIAHDFNNVLTVILSCADALRRDLADGAPEAQEEVEEVRVAAERARDLTRQLLAFARRQVIEPVPLDLNALLLKNERLLRRLLTEDIALRIAVAPAVGTILCDPSQMEQILLNLAVNARDAMPKGGELTIEAANLDVTEAYAALYPGIRPGPHVRLAVHDTGAGMPPEVLEHIFEPFFTTKELGRGTGLGLATVYGIVRQSDGFVRVESAMGHGTTFEMLFPRVAQAPQAETQFPQLPESLHGSETVLVVEDEPQVRIVSARALRSAGYRVIEAASGLEALNALASHGGAVHLVVTDGVMPGMNGRELIEAIRPKWPRVRVLMVSGHAHDVLEQRNLLEDGLALLEKPFTLPMLLKKVRVVLDGQ